MIPKGTRIKIIGLGRKCPHKNSFYGHQIVGKTGVVFGDKGLEQWKDNKFHHGWVKLDEVVIDPTPFHFCYLRVKILKEDK
jgi:hypothetical protein